MTENKIKNIINGIQKYYKKYKIDGAIIGISGGKDSSVALLLLEKSIGSKNIIALTLPIESNRNDQKDAENLAKSLNIKTININLNNIYKDYINNISNILNIKKINTNESNINLKPRLRNITMYYIARLISDSLNKKYIVIGTTNKCEDYVGYYTKGETSDLDILRDLTVSEIIEIGKYLKINNKILTKAPSDGLSNLTDEEKLGLKYKDIEKYLNNKPINKKIKQKISKLHQNSLHKKKTKIIKK